MSQATEELRVMVELIKEARSNGIVELQYKDLKVRFSPAAQQGQPGAAQFSPAMPVRATAPTWQTSIQLPQSPEEA